MMMIFIVIIVSWWGNVITVGYCGRDCDRVYFDI